MDILDEKWSFIEKRSTLLKIEFFNAKLVLHSKFFTFNNKYYKQTYGAPMGSLLFPLVADLILQKLESDILNKFIIKPIFYYRFVDDIALSAGSLPFALVAINHKPQQPVPRSFHCSSAVSGWWSIATWTNGRHSFLLLTLA